ncbi:MAG: hypothetical protein ACTSU2_04670 [Promethearchaeota archaeon]
MPKYKKGRKYIQKAEETKQSLLNLKKSMFNSALKSLIIAAVFLVLSLLFNGEIIKISAESGTAKDILLLLSKAAIITLYYLFVVIGFANARELEGRPIGLMEIIFIAIFSLIQSIRSAAVFWLSLSGVLLVTLYLWVVQIKVEQY